MAWEDRTKKQKAQARQAAREYAKTDDAHLYVVTTGKGTRITVTGINSAKVVAGKDGHVPPQVALPGGAAHGLRNRAAPPVHRHEPGGSIR